jgi:outer membrane protein assembly factor BamD (BamD/ComL family)
MSVSGISSSSFLNNQSIQNNFQQFQQIFQQLGQDLQSGNLSAAQSDFATLQKLQPQNNAASSSQINNPVAQAFNQLAQDLQSGNLFAAQQDYTTIQQAFQNQTNESQSTQAQSTLSQSTQGHRHHHGASDSGSGGIGQLLSQLGTALQSGDLTSAQSTFTALQQELEQFTQNAGQTSSQSAANGVSVTA